MTESDTIFRINAEYSSSSACTSGPFDLSHVLLAIGRPLEAAHGSLRLTEGDLAPVACLEYNAEKCARKVECRTLPMWNELNKRINDYLDSVSLADLMKKDTGNG